MRIQPSTLQLQFHTFSQFLKFGIREPIRFRLVDRRGLAVIRTRLLWRRTKDEYARVLLMDEGRKRVLLIAASILAARKLMNWDGRPSPALESAIADAIATAERIMARIDSRWPAREDV
jgi:hypothetical protein